MSSLGFQAVYRLLNDMDTVACERVFLAPFSLESHRPLKDFDMVAFSLSFENDYPNMLAILEAGGLPLRAAHRAPPHPLVLAGGVTSFLNPEPVAPFIDCFLIGEAEALLPPFMELFREKKDRRTFLERAAQSIKGVYVPSFYTPEYAGDGTLKRFTPNGDVPAKVQRAFVPDLGNFPTFSSILTPHTTFDQTFLIEVSRGCPHGCRFCCAGFVYRPVRFRSLELLRDCLDRGTALTSKIGLMGAAVSDLPDIEALCRHAARRNARLSFGSLRADSLTDELIDALVRGGVKTATVAPDAGSERMRRVINKGVSEDDVLKAAERLVAAGVPNLKLYFMVGLPTETPDDVEAIVVLTRRVKHRFLKASKERGRIGTIQVSLSSFVPKPFTPFQWAPLDEVADLKAKIRKVQKGLRSVPNVRVHGDVPRWAYVQALLSRGDRRVAQILALSHDLGGNWPQALKQSALNADFYVYRERPLDELLPWDFIDHGIHKEYLIEEYHKALQAAVTPPCDVGRCTRCGVCPSPLPAA